MTLTQTLRGVLALGLCSSLHVDCSHPVALQLEELLSEDIHCFCSTAAGDEYSLDVYFDYLVLP